MHPLLENQLQQLGIAAESAPSDQLWELLLGRISMDYVHADNDRRQLELSARLSSDNAVAKEPDDLASDAAKQVSQALLGTSPDTVLLFNEQLEIVSSGNIDAIIDPRLKGRFTHAGAAEVASALGVDVYAQLKMAVQSVGLSKESKRLLFELFHASGPVAFEARIVPDRQDNGVYTAVFIRDWSGVTRSNRAAQMYKDLFDAASEGMMLLDVHQRAILVNRSFELMCDQTADELRAQENPSFLNEAGKPLDTEIWSQVFYHDTWSGEASFRHQSGLNVPVWLTIDALKDDEGQNTHFLILSRDITQLKETQQQLSYFASHDQLTGLPNRAYFQEHLSDAIARSKRTGAMGALFFMDLDNFKSINDTLGHPVGDALLKEMAKRLSEFVRDGEMVSRFGGDEFTLVVENLGQAEDAAIVAQRVLKEFESPFDCDGKDLDMRCSIGISLFPQDSDCHDSIIRQADTAMYAAKQAGRSTFKFYTSQLTHKAVKSFNMETQLRRAIEREELFLNFQPQLDMKRRKLLGAEVLLRWQNEQHGFISPAEFVPVAEASGLIEDIGAWVLDKTCEQIKHWHHFKGTPFVVSVNASRKELVRRDFTQRVSDTLSKHGLQGQQLEIEVTESAIANSEKMVIANLHGLRELGCKLAIDDFGTGYSSLSSLQKFPLDRLKIDRSFVQDLGQDLNADAIVAAIIALAKTLGLGVIAEGVESQQQIKALLKKGCREGQGYYYSKPLMAPEFREYVLKSRRA